MGCRLQTVGIRAANGPPSTAGQLGPFVRARRLPGFAKPVAGSQNSSLQIVIPKEIHTKLSDNSKVETKQLSYIIRIDEQPYTVHLKKRFLLSDNFMVYVYNEGSLNSHYLNLQGQCYYQGYVEGYPNSVVSLSTCSGLRGMLQFENVSYGIEPLDSDTDFKHVLYKFKNENKRYANVKSYQYIEENEMEYHHILRENLKPPVADTSPLYLETHIVVDKPLIDYLGSDTTVVTNKIIEVIGFVNSMFAQLKVTVVIASLELWSDYNKISTVGEADELLQRFLKWKNTFLTLRPHDIALLLVYSDHPEYVGTTFPGKACFDHYSAVIALYPKQVTLEEFSVIVTQMLGISLGISYDDIRECQCSGLFCIMNPEAMRFSGVKTFSSCSLSDFENFILNSGAKCLQNKPQLKATGPSCGNGIVESGEQCDCGSEDECGAESCCDYSTCKLKSWADCDRGLCCTSNCKFRPAGHVCRDKRHAECDIIETCNGTSGECARDITVIDGHLCKSGQFMCFNGNCQDLDDYCVALFGQGSRNAPFNCYEEINSQHDRFGNCGFENGKYIFCPWRDLICGRLICTYPSTVPFHRDNASVIYAYIKGTLCVTIDYRVPVTDPDPMRVESGANCDTDRVCYNGKCLEKRWLVNRARTCTARCNNHGVNLFTEKTLKKAGKERWLLASYIALPGLIVTILIAVSWDRWKKCFVKEEEYTSTE
ncbi:disintegrin and metalloproteinase domain-containing protein 32 [Sorex araneus]|uniref:disintegrin and metalloproteinase domain-containing protein 32 n=1 Tax=Sorex araneus TaxID=42254 RepID=UPI00064ABA12|nr:disintegrin and metalloproteinase domain-containing protein 32 [Sorex araneus]